MSARSIHNLALLFLLAVVILSITIVLPGKFLTVINFQSMGSQFPEFALLALAMMLAMITGGIDLSVVAIANLAGVVAAFILSRSVGTDVSPYLAIAAAVVAALSVAALCGLVNGILVAWINVPPILATLGTQAAFMGMAIVITRGSAFSIFPEEYAFVGNGTVLGIPFPLILFVIAAVAVAIVLKQSPQGFSMKMLGSSPIVSRFSGIRNDRILIKTYVFVALLAGVAALIIISRSNSMRAGYGEAYLLSTILVAVLGRTDPDGGEENLLGVVLGILILQATQSGLNILSISPFFTKFVWGAALLSVLVAMHFIPKIQKQRQVRLQKRALAAAGAEHGSKT